MSYGLYLFHSWRIARRKLLLRRQIPNVCLLRANPHQPNHTPPFQGMKCKVNTARIIEFDIHVQDLHSRQWSASLTKSVNYCRLVGRADW